MTRHIKRGGKVWIRDLPRQADHQEAARDPHGQGQGQPRGWVAVVRPGRIIFEIEGVDAHAAQEAFHLARHKLPIPTGSCA